MSLPNNPPANTDALANREALVTQATQAFIARATSEMEDAQSVGLFYVDVQSLVYVSFTQVQTYFQALGYTVTIPAPYIPPYAAFTSYPPYQPYQGVANPFGDPYTAWFPYYPHRYGYIPQLPVGFGQEWIDYCVANQVIGFTPNLIRIAWGS
jgi:hypothetical protein